MDYMNRIPTGKTAASPRLNSGERTAVIMLGGQSNSCNTGEGGYSIQNPTKLDNINLWDGGTYVATESLLGCGGNGTYGSYNGKVLSGNFALRMADGLVTDGVFDRIILVPYGVSGTAVYEWRPGSKLNDLIVVAYKRVRALGLQPTLWLWHQGESDTLATTSQSDYESRMMAIINTPRLLGDTAPWFVSGVSYISSMTSAAVRAAQAAVCNGTNIFPGPDTDPLTLADGYRITSGFGTDAHFNSAGLAAAGVLAKQAIAAHF